MTTQFTNPLHLYRSLLRETTYLIDPNVRSYFKKYVTESYRQKTATIAKSSRRSLAQDGEHLPDLAERKQLSRGRKLLSILQRANQGYRLPFTSVIQLAYGRKGYKRRELMQNIMMNDASENVSTPAANTYDTNWTPPARFRFLLQSQLKVKPTLDDSRQLRSRPDIPLKNRKGLPLPKCRVKNVKKKWYARTAKLLLPPLEEQEWNQLKERSDGVGFVFPARRPTANIPVFAESQPARDPNQAHLLEGPIKPLSQRMRAIIGSPNHLTSRLLKRTYTRVLLKNTPKVMPTSEGKGSNLYWDDGQKRLPSVHKLTAEHSDRLFGSIS